ncbi:MAG: 2-oxo-4-hydroxy-4-carboxy-5-ureidoimidazoline decarboxylase [Planctomycetota bacterium]
MNKPAMTNGVVEWLNGLPSDGAYQEFLKCCGASWWCERMVEARSFESPATLVDCADRLFDAMPDDAWLEAFASHPKIGDLESLRMKLAGNRQWSSGEQAGVQQSDEETLVGLAEGNQQYEKRFGYIFIICATGLSAARMLSELVSRLENDDAVELKIAAAEQRKITHLRLAKLAAK